MFMQHVRLIKGEEVEVQPCCAESFASVQVKSACLVRLLHSLCFYEHIIRDAFVRSQ